MAAASIWSAVVTYVVMTVAARALPQDRATVFLTFLALLFALYGVLSGLALEITRAVAAAVRDDHAPGPRLWQVAAAASVVVGGVVLASAPLWRSRVVHDADVGLVVAVVLAAAGYAWHCLFVGAAVGLARWGDAAQVIVAEATVRLLATVAVVVTTASLAPLGVATAAGAFAWMLLVVLSRQQRSSLHLRADCSSPVLARRVGAALLAQGASAVLVVGFPVLLAATTAPDDYRSAAPLILAVSLTRAPVLLPLNALQGVVVSQLVRASDRLGRTLVKMLALVVIVGVVGAVAAWVVGPTLLRLLFGGGYVVDGSVLALLTLAAAGTAALTLTGACAQAMAHHSSYLAGWLVAVAACVALLQLPGSMETRTCLALGVSPLVGLVVHVAGLVLGRSRKPVRTSA